ncbi:MAG: DNA-processing protein DprA [Bacteroidia bacterium]|nr:DNA-processing protein DprA [Bacteroidia bacterium]
MIEGVGPVTARKLIAYSGGVAPIFSSKKSILAKIPGIRDNHISGIFKDDLLPRAEKELKFIEKNDIQTYYFLDENYPRRIKELDDSPVLLFGKGNLQLNSDRVISIVGTRNATEYGKLMTSKIVEELAPFQPLILSGLAYGIDIAAHKAALDIGLQTVGVVGHGLDTLYPSLHKPIAEKMMENGGVLSAYPSKTSIDPNNFPDRNRIVAAMTDAVLVMEAGASGGALITANFASEFKRDVMAFPGRSIDPFSAGCNDLIKKGKAKMVESSKEIADILGWRLDNQNTKPIQKQLFVELDEVEQQIWNTLKLDGKLKMDILSLKIGKSLSQTSSTLFNLELKGIVKCYPGTIYGLV